MRAFFWGSSFAAVVTFAAWTAAQAQAPRPTAPAADPAAPTAAPTPSDPAPADRAGPGAVSAQDPSAPPTQPSAAPAPDAPPPQYPPGGPPPGPPPAAGGGGYPPGPAGYPPGGYPPPGNYPPGSYPTPGAYPPGSYPPGSYPPGAYPPPGGYVAEAEPPREQPRPGKRTHEGFYLRLGLGWSHVTGEFEYLGIKDDVSDHGVGVELALGGTVAPGLVIGGGIFSSAFSDADVSGQIADYEADVSAGMVGVFGDWYIEPRAGLHVQAGVGFGSASLDVVNGFEDEDSSYGGLGLMGGIGYEVFVADEWSIGGLARVIYVDVKEDRGGEEYNLRLLTPGVLFTGTYH